MVEFVSEQCACVACRPGCVSDLQRSTACDRQTHTHMCDSQSSFSSDWFWKVHHDPNILDLGCKSAAGSYVHRFTGSQGHMFTCSQAGSHVLPDHLATPTAPICVTARAFCSSDINQHPGQSNLELSSDGVGQTSFLLFPYCLFSELPDTEENILWRSPLSRVSLSCVAVHLQHLERRADLVGAKA